MRKFYKRQPIDLRNNEAKTIEIGKIRGNRVAVSKKLEKLEKKLKNKTFYTKNICPLFSSLISNNYCSYRELEEYYTFNDVLDMVEILAVKNANINLYNQAYEELLNDIKKN